MNSAMNTQVAGSGTLDAPVNRVLQQAESTARADRTPAAHEKTMKAGKDFESILLGSWLQQAEQSFAKVPGGDGEEDEDSGKDQFQGIAMQALAGSLTASGGIGIAKMITKYLQKDHPEGETSSTGAQQS